MRTKQSSSQTCILTLKDYRVLAVNLLDQNKLFIIERSYIKSRGGTGWRYVTTISQQTTPFLESPQEELNDFIFQLLNDVHDGVT